MKTLVFKCEDGEPGYLNWTVPTNAPDQLYYQVRAILETKRICNSNSTYFSVLYT